MRYDAAGSEAVTDADGRWKLSLDLSATDGLPHQLIIEGKNRLTPQDVVVGELWLASGQSNTQMPLNANVVGGKEAAGSDSLDLRWFVARTTDKFLPPQEHFPGSRIKADAVVSMDYPAVACYFGKELSADLRAPVGVVLTAVGGAAIQPFMSREVIDAEDGLGQATKQNT